MITQVYFWFFSIVALACGLGVLACRHPIHGALSLIGAMVSLAGIYSLIGAPFLATIQVLVYAGAIMMLLVFVIMVLNSAKDEKTPWFDALGAASLFPALAIGGVLVKAVWSANVRHPFLVAGSDGKGPGPVRGTVEAISTTLFPDKFGPWSFLFLVVGLLLLSAIVGAVLLAKRHLDSPVESDTTHSGGH